MPTTATRLQAAIHTSRLITTTRNILRSSVFYTLLNTLYTALISIDRTDISRYYTTATTYTYYHAISATFTTASSTAVTRRLGETLVRWTKAAYFYRWLTKEPEPDVIVIDLRDTLSVGPFIALLDYLIVRLIPASHRSRLVKTTTRSIESFKTKPVRYTSLFIIIVLTINTLLTISTDNGSRLGVIIRLLLIGVSLAGTQVTLTWSELISTRPVQLLIAALEPPEPPEWDDQNNDPPSNRP